METKIHVYIGQFHGIINYNFTSSQTMPFEYIPVNALQTSEKVEL